MDQPRSAARIERRVDRVASVPRPRAPEIRFDPFAKVVKTPAEPRETDPAKEAARLVALGRSAFAATGNDHTVKPHDTQSWELAKTITWDIGRTRSIAFSTDGTLAAAGSDTGKVVVWGVDL